MKLFLPDALHARPANLLVRLAARFDATIEVAKGGCFADASKILDVLALGAAKGDEIEVRARGNAAEAAIAHIAELIARNFDADLVPETGAAAVEGIAIGRALVVSFAHEESREKGTPAEESAVVHRALARVASDLEALILALPAEEAQLFEPELPILLELEACIVQEIEKGASAEEAVRAATDAAPTDLVLDARARLLAALSGREHPALTRAAEPGEAGEVILVTDSLAPSLVALLPAHVRGIVAGIDDTPGPGARGAPGTHTSHAAILARGRDLPLAFVPTHVAAAIGDNDMVIVDTTESSARVWVTPSVAMLDAARTRRTALVKTREEAEARAAESALGVHVELLVNIGSIDERVPPGAQGIGLLRTELAFAGRSTPPNEAEHFAALLSVARRARGPVTARLFDAGGDKPLAWLASPGADDDLRGIALLLAHPSVLEAQLRAIVRAAAQADVRALIPMTRGPEDVEAVRALAPSVKIGAMIETPEAAAAIDAIAAVSDFICIGTNDLTAYTLGIDRGAAVGALDPRVLDQVRRIIRGAHGRGRNVTVCGEIASDPRGACILVGLGADALSVAPARLPALRIALGGVKEDDCREAAQGALASIVEAR